MMSIRSSASRKAFVVFNLLGLALLAILCLAPFVHLLALSLSSNLSAASGEVGLLPVQPTLEAYRYLLQKPDFFRAAGVSLLRVVVGTLINMGIIILTAYPLSKPTARFKKRTFYVWFFAITMFFSGGLIPSYMVIRALGLLDSFWVFILPGALSVWNVIMLLNFFRGGARGPGGGRHRGRRQPAAGAGQGLPARVPARPGHPHPLHCGGPLERLV